MDDVAVTVNGPDPFVEADWDAYVEWAKHVVQSGQRVASILTFSPFQSPNAAQRQKIAATTQQAAGTNTFVALVTDSAAVRGAMTALSWLSRSLHMKGFRPMESDLAIAWLGGKVTFDQQAARDALKRGVAMVGYTTQDVYRWFS